MSTPIQLTPQQWAVLAHVVRELTRSRRMSAADAEDFGQTVLLKLVERDFDVFRRFSGRSTLKTYLRVVVKRMLLDWQNHTYGKWRPSVAAARLGEHAVTLERLICRDGFTVDEAVAMVSTRPGAPSELDLYGVAERLARRLPARKLLAPVLEEHRWVEFEDPLQARDEEREDARVRASLAAAVGELSPDDRQLIALRYEQKRTVQSVAHLLQVDTKALYRRFDRLLRSLRNRLSQQGVTGPGPLETVR